VQDQVAVRAAGHDHVAGAGGRALEREQHLVTLPEGGRHAAAPHAVPQRRGETVDPGRHFRDAIIRAPERSRQVPSSGFSRSGEHLHAPDSGKVRGCGSDFTPGHEARGKPHG